MGLFSTQNSFFPFFMYLSHRNRKLDPQLLGHDGKVPNREKWTCSKDGHCTQNNFPPFSPYESIGMWRTWTTASWDMTGRFQKGKNEPTQKWAYYSKVFSSHFLCFHQWKKGELDLKLLGTWREGFKKEKMGLPKKWADYSKVFSSHFYCFQQWKKGELENLKKCNTWPRASSPSREGLGQLKTGPTQKMGTVPKSSFLPFAQ